MGLRAHHPRGFHSLVDLSSTLLYVTRAEDDQAFVCQCCWSLLVLLQPVTAGVFRVSLRVALRAWLLQVNKGAYIRRTSTGVLCTALTCASARSSRGVFYRGNRPRSRCHRRHHRRRHGLQAWTPCIASASRSTRTRATRWRLRRSWNIGKNPTTPIVLVEERHSFYQGSQVAWMLGLAIGGPLLGSRLINFSEASQQLFCITCI